MAPDAAPPTTLDASEPDVLEQEALRALSVFYDGRPSEARRLLRSVRRRAERRGDEPAARTVVARTLITEAGAHFDTTGDLPGALELLGRAERIADEIGSGALQAAVRGQRALLVLRGGDTRAALAAFDAAVAVMDAAPHRDRALVLLNRGVLHLEGTDLLRATDDLSRSVRHAEDAGDVRLTAMARHNLGYVDFLAGRIPAAIAAFEEAGRDFPGGPSPVMRLDHARALREAGLVRDADDVLAAAAETMLRERLWQDLGETELVRAECALVEGDHRSARAFTVAARRRFVRRGNVRWQRKAELLLLRCERAALADRTGPGRRRALLGLAGRARALAESCHAEGRADLGRSAELVALECRLRAELETPGDGRRNAAGSSEPAEPSPAAEQSTAGEQSTAAGRLADAVPGDDGVPAAVLRIRPTDPLATRLQKREVRALRALLAGDRAAAVAEVRRGLEELGAYQSGLGSLDLRTAGAVHGVTLAQLGLGVAVEDGAPARVLSTVERSRAISARLPQVRPPSDELTARLLGELRHVEEEVRGLEGETEAAERLAALRARATGLQRDIRARSWQVEGDVSAVLDSPRLAQVREAVRAEGSVFVSFARHRGDWLAVVVRPGGATVVPLAPAAEVADLVRRLRADLDAVAMPHLPAPLVAAVRGSVAAGTARLDALLLAPLGVAGQPLVLSCSGPLAVLPWTLLPSRAGLPTVVTPAAATWLRATRRTGRPAVPRPVAVAGPGLAQAEEEARAVAGTWTGGRLLTGADAHTAAARAALAEADVLHVAAHGTHRPQSPLFSSLRLADGALYAYELDPGAGVPHCVTLSACEAGLATLRPGDEGLGLTHVLLHLGVRAVVAGVSRVRDDAAADTMTRMHAAMAAGVPVAAALARAQQETDPEAPPAPFVCFGADW